MKTEYFSQKNKKKFWMNFISLED